MLTLRTSLPNGWVARVRGVFSYRVNDANKLVALRGYWTMEDVKLEPAAG